MRLLGVAHLAGIAAGTFGQELLAVAPCHFGARRLQRHVREGHRVGPHVGDEPLLVERLRNLHDSRGRQAQASARLLLQGGGDERRPRPAAVRLRGHRGHLGVRPVQILRQPARPGFVQHHDIGRGELPVGPEVPPCGEAPAVDGTGGHDEALAGTGRGGRLQRPVAGGHERHSLALALDDDAGSHALHPSGRQPGRHLLPQNRRDLVAVEAVQQPAGLLGVHEPPIHVPGVRQRRPDGVGGDLVEHEPAHGHLRRGREHFEQVPSDRLTLAVLVGCQIQLVGSGHQLLEVAHRVPLGVAQHVQRLEAVLHVDAEARPGLPAVRLGNVRGLRREVAHVAARRLHGVAVVQEACDRRGLGGRFDDDDPLRRGGCGHGQQDTG